MIILYMKGKSKRKTMRKRKIKGGTGEAHILHRYHNRSHVNSRPNDDAHMGDGVFRSKGLNWDPSVGRIGPNDYKGYSIQNEGDILHVYATPVFQGYFQRDAIYRDMFYLGVYDSEMMGPIYSINQMGRVPNYIDSLSELDQEYMNGPPTQTLEVEGNTNNNLLNPELYTGITDSSDDELMTNRCMTEEEYGNCEKNTQNETYCGISLLELNRKDAVKLPDNNNVCYDRKNLRTWVDSEVNHDRIPTSPMTRERIPREWIHNNLNEGECVESESGGGKRRTRKQKGRGNPEDTGYESPNPNARKPGDPETPGHHLPTYWKGKPSVRITDKNKSKDNKYRQHLTEMDKLSVFKTHPDLEKYNEIGGKGRRILKKKQRKTKIKKSLKKKQRKTKRKSRK